MENVLPYLQDWKFYSDVSELLFDMLPLPHFLEDWPSQITGITDLPARWKMNEKMSPDLFGNQTHFAFLFMGPQGATSALHTDDHSTHGWYANPPLVCLKITMDA